MGNTPTNQKQKKQIEKYIFVQILLIIFYNLLKKKKIIKI